MDDDWRDAKKINICFCKRQKKKLLNFVSFSLFVVGSFAHFSTLLEGSFVIISC